LEGRAKSKKKVTITIAEKFEKGKKESIDEGRESDGTQ